MNYTQSAKPYSPRPRTHPYLLWIAAGFALVLICLMAAQRVSAQDAAATPAATGAPTGAGTVGQTEINDVARQLWCPLCSGVRLDACELKACTQMKEVIGQKLAQGVDVQTIKNYFVAQYGPQVLGEPPLEGFNWLAWILPIGALVLGGLFVWSRARKMVRKPAPADSPADAAPSAAAGDDYSRKLDEELKHYD